MLVPLGDCKVPDALSCDQGGMRERGRIKEDPRDFCVEENHPGFCCTVSPESDLAEITDMAADTEYVAVTLVKGMVSTPDAVAEFADIIGVPYSDVSIYGQKDTRARTAQRVLVRTKNPAAVVRECRPEPLPEWGPGSFLKDATAASEAARYGHFVGNRFTIRVSLPGWSESRISRYLVERLAPLMSDGMRFPNAFGPQRYARRQNLHRVGQTLIVLGVEPALKQYITETSQSENGRASRLREELLVCWQRAEEEAGRRRCSVARIQEEFRRMVDLVEPVRNALHMDIEYRILKEVLRVQNFEEVVHRLIGDIGLWMGAFKAYWYNQVLAAAVSGSITLPGPSIPLYQEDPAVKRWYRDVGFGHAVPDVVDRFAATLHPLGIAWRPAFVQAKNFTSRTTKGSWHTSFELPPGCFATTFLNTIFEIND